MESQESSFSFDKYWLVMKRRWMPAVGVFIPILVLSIFASSLKKPSYEAQGTLQFQRINTISSLTGVGGELGKLEPLVQDNKTSPLNTEAEVIRSVPIVQKTIDTLNLKDNKGTPLRVPDFLKNLTVKDIKGTDVLQVSYKDTNPKIAAEVVNTVMSVYLAHNVSSRRIEASAARKFIERQLPNAELIVRKAEAELREFKEKNKVVSIEQESNKAVEMMSNLEQQIQDIKAKIADANAQLKSIREQLGMSSQKAIVMTSLSQTPGVQDVLKEAQLLESQLATRRVILQDSHPEIIALKNKLAALRGIVEQRIIQLGGTSDVSINSNFQLGGLQQQLATKLVELESYRLGLNSEFIALKNTQENYRARMSILPKLEQQHRQLERKVQASQSTYSLLLQKLQESRIAENQNVGNASKVSEAQVPREPNSSPMTSYLSAALLATLASAATTYLLEIKDKSIKTLEEARELTELTLLGVIPAISKPKISILGNEDSESLIPKVVVRDNPRSSISEAYRMLRANLKFMSADKELKVIVVTSSVPREGKSAVAANLAAAMAQMERKVLLIDGDLHRPVQHKIWDLPNNQGLSNVIVGQVEIRAAITKVMDNFDVLTSGVVPPSPASLLDSKRMAALIQNFAASYDFVIIDAPSLNLAADAATLGQMADGVLLVVRPGVVDSVNAAFAKELLEKSGQNVLGQVVNGVITKNERHSYYYFNEEYNMPENVNQNASIKTEK